MGKPTFIAIDFETADHGRDSACAVGIVKVRGTRIVHEETRLIRPPRRTFCFSYLHHITWEDVADKPAFRQVWRTLRPLFEDVDFLAAHNAPFDRSVLHKCCETARIRPPHQDFVCTVRTHDARVRSAAFEWLADQVMRYGDVLPGQALAKGFFLDDIRVPLVGPRSIFKPRSMPFRVSMGQGSSCRAT